MGVCVEVVCDGSEWCVMGVLWCAKYLLGMLVMGGIPSY